MASPDPGPHSHERRRSWNWSAATAAALVDAERQQRRLAKLGFLREEPVTRIVRRRRDDFTSRPRQQPCRRIEAQFVNVPGLRLVGPSP